jgi:hypothetical protein
MKLNSSLWLLGLCLVAPATAAAQTVYYSVGKEIRTVPAAGGASTLVHTSTMLVGDLALCAGDPADTDSDSAQYLYYVERGLVGADRISRLNVKAPLTKKVLVNGTAEQIFEVANALERIGELRLTPTCDVLFATSAGVFRVNGTPPFPATATPEKNSANADIVTANGGSGLAVAFDGSLRYSDGTALKSALSGFGATSAGSAIVGLGVANAGHGSTTPARLPSVPVGQQLAVGPVCASALNAITCFRKAGGNLDSKAFATFDAVNKAQFFEFLTNDTAIVATSVNASAGLGGSAKFNGILWRVDAGPLTELARGPKVNGEFVPIVGVAVGPSTATAPAVTTVPGSSQYVNFGPVAFDVQTPSPCNLSITLRQLTWPTAHAKLNSVGAAKYLLDRGMGGESWVDDVDVVPTGNCGMSATTPAVVGIAQYIENAPSRAVLHCTGNSCDVATQGNFPYSTPDDERDSALPDNFSDFLTARIDSTAARIVFAAPFSNNAVVTGAIDSEIAAATSHNATGGLSIRFRICANESCTAFAPAEVPFPPTTGAGLSVTRLHNESGVAIADCSVTDQGSSTPDLPVFRTSSTDGTAHNFNLNTPFGGPPACQQSGLFVATVFSHGGKFTKTSILFRLN